MRGNTIFYRGYDMGLPVKEKIKYCPYLFIPKNDGKYKSISGERFEKLQFDSIKEARDFSRQYEDVANFKIYGLDKFSYLFIYDQFPNHINHDPDLIRKVTIDIECKADAGFPSIEKADKEITAITIRFRGKNFSFGCGEFTPLDSRTEYIKCKDEYELILSFIQTWESINPDVVTGWNIEFFDIPYLVNRIRLLFNDSACNRLSPWKMIDSHEVEYHNKINVCYTFVGITTLDYYQLYRKFSFSNSESYKLDYIAQVVLKEKKLDYSEYGSLLELYKNNFQKFISYNILDCVLVDKLDDKLGFIDQVIAFAYSAKVNFTDTLTTIRPSDMIIHAHLMNNGIVIPPVKKNTLTQTLMGGHVKPPKIGKSRWVLSFDLDSLYPHLIMEFNISPETFIERLENFTSIPDLVKKQQFDKNSGISYAANGCTYRRDIQGFLPAIMQELYDDRVKYKKAMLEAKKKFNETKDPKYEKEISRYHNLQLSKKISLNSFYGSLANPYFRWFDFNYAESITSSGQLVIMWTERKLNEYLNRILKTNDIDYVIASDTDSIYLELEKVALLIGEGKTDREISYLLDQFAQDKIEPYLAKIYQELAEYMNAYQQKMHMKRETIADVGIWKAAKMYVLNAYDIEGVEYNPPIIKVTGLEAVRSSTPQVCRENIKEALKIILNGTEPEFHKFVAKFREKFDTLTFEQVASPRSVNNMTVYADKQDIYKKGTPIQVKGSLIFNSLLDKYNIISIPKISDGDKVKFAYLKVPNPIQSTVISSADTIPSEFGIDDYIDKDMQFSKTFIKPVEEIASIIGWSTEHRATLKGFFS